MGALDSEEGELELSDFKPLNKVSTDEFTAVCVIPLKSSFFASIYGLVCLFFETQNRDSWRDIPLNCQANESKAPPDLEVTQTSLSLTLTRPCAKNQQIVSKVSEVDSLLVVLFPWQGFCAFTMLAFQQRLNKRFFGDLLMLLRGYTEAFHKDCGHRHVEIINSLSWELLC